jgi:copper chaperone CopZ
MHDNCHVDPVHKTVTDEEQQTVETVTLAVWGMACPNCAMRVRNSLVAVRGVVNAHVDYHMGMAEVLFNPNMVAIPTLIDAVAEAGNDGRHQYRAALLMEWKGR